MSAVRIKADERVGKSAGEPYITVFIERRAVLDQGLETVQEREVASLRLEIGFRDPTVYSLAPRHLDDLIDLLRRTRDRVMDITEPETNEDGPA